MGIVKNLAVAAVVLGSMSTAAMAADLIVDVPTPDEIITSGWDGGYVGVTGGYYSSNFIDGQVVLGGNLTFSETFLLGAEVGVGAFYGLGGGATGLELVGQVRAGFLASDTVLLYGTVGYELYSGGGGNPYAGAGIEFKATEDVSLRGQVVVFNTGVVKGSAGAFWHF